MPMVRVKPPHGGYRRAGRAWPAPDSTATVTPDELEQLQADIRLLVEELTDEPKSKPEPEPDSDPKPKAKAKK